MYLENFLWKNRQKFTMFRICWLWRKIGELIFNKLNISDTLFDMKTIGCLKQKQTSQIVMLYIFPRPNLQNNITSSFSLSLFFCFKQDKDRLLFGAWCFQYYKKYSSGSKLFMKKKSIAEDCLSNISSQKQSYVSLANRVISSVCFFIHT